MMLVTATFGAPPLAAQILRQTDAFAVLGLALLTLFLIVALYAQARARRK